MQATLLAIEIKKLKSIRSVYRHLIAIMVMYMVWLMFVTTKSNHSILRDLSGNKGKGIELLQNHAQFFEITVLMGLGLYFACYGLCLLKIRKTRIKARQF